MYINPINDICQLLTPLSRVNYFCSDCLKINELLKIMPVDAAHMTSLFENATEGIIFTNGQGQIVLANPAAEKMFGYSDMELRNLPVEVLLPSSFRTGHKNLREGFHK